MGNVAVLCETCNDLGQLIVYALFLAAYNCTLTPRSSRQRVETEVM
jgi:hypothetical protein